MGKYYVDERAGCVAVRETVDYAISPGCHSDLPDVLAYWPGRTNTDENGKFISHEVESWKIEKAKTLCDILNINDEL